MLIDRMVHPLLRLPRWAKRAVALGGDAALCVLTVWAAFSLRVGEWVSLSEQGWPAAAISLLLALPIFVVFGLYRAVFRYVSWEALTAIVQAVTVYGIIYAAVFTAFAIPGVPRTVGIIQPVLLLLAVGATRAAVRYILGGQYRHMLRRGYRKYVLIYGAGQAGRQLALALKGTTDLRAVGFIDDASDLHGSIIGKLKVWAPSALEALVERRGVSEIFLAVPSASRARRNEIIGMLRPLGVAVRSLPGLLDLAHGRLMVSDVKPLEIEDLLGRDAVEPDSKLMEKNIRGKTILVTGAGGSIGSELCRQIAKIGPSTLLLLDQSEFSLYAIHGELSALFGEDMDIVPLLGSVCDGARLSAIFEACRPNTVYHAAAYKHVPLVEHNLIEGVRNNVLGTFTCADLARRYEVSDFVLISTDKAVRPTNVMGASKRLAEMALQAIAADGSQTRFAMVRFGNVLGSSGSVVPLFRRQIDAGGPVTVTHPEINRYFMTIPEAAQLVIQAGAMAKGGEVFVLDMGDPVKVVDLAVRMIELAGLVPKMSEDDAGDIEIVFSGLRPGEKLYEELLIGDNPMRTMHPRVMMANEKFIPRSSLEGELESLRRDIGRQDVRAVRRRLSQLVAEYVPAADLVDWIAGEDARRTRPDSRRTTMRSSSAAGETA